MLETGKKAPSFRLPSSEGGDLSLSDLKGKYVVLYFYPKDDTPGCTQEAKDFRDAAKKLDERGAVVVGISKDSVASHCKFRDKYELTFPLLSDAEGDVLTKYGAWGEKNMYGKKSLGIIRTTVLIDPEGKVRHVFKNVRVNGHVDAVMKALDEAGA